MKRAYQYCFTALNSSDRSCCACSAVPVRPTVLFWTSLFWTSGTFGVIRKGEIPPSRTRSGQGRTLRRCAGFGWRVGFRLSIDSGNVTGAMTSTVTSRRKQLGNELRHARTSAGLTQQQVAAILGCTQGKVNKIESGAVGAKLGDVRAMLEAYGIGEDEADTLLELARAAASRRGHWSGYRSVVPHWFRTFTDLEPAAVEIMTWHGERIPGPLQSEHYMLKQFTEFGATDVTSLMRNRLDRKAVFEQQQPPYYRFILSESALRRAPGGHAPGVMLDQLQHMLELEQRSRVYLHVLPFDAKLAAVPNDFTIMRFPDRTQDFIYLEHAAGGIYLDEVKDFQLFVDAWDRLRGAALERPETRNFLQKLAQEHREALEAE